MKISRLVLMSFLFWALSTPALGGENLLAQILNKGELIIATDMTATPMQFRDKDGKATGFTVELMELMAQKLGVKVKWLDLQWESLLPALMSGKTDMIAANMSMTLERMKTIRFSNPYFLTGVTCMTLKDAPYVSWKDLDQENLTIATTMGSVHGDYIEKEMKAKAALYDSKAESLSELLNGRVNAIMDDELICLDLVKNNQHTKMLQGYVRPDIYGLTFRQGSEIDTFVEWVNNFLMNAKLMGEYNQLYMKWFGKEWSPSWID